MVAITARFITPRKPSGAAAFGGLIDLLKIFLRAGRSMPVVCSECQTINRHSATVCKGCDGKLPAFYTQAGSGAPPSSAGDARALLARAARSFSVPARWRTVVWVGVALVALFGSFGLWYAMYSAAAGRPLPVQAPLVLPAVAPAPGLAASAAPVAEPAFAADLSKPSEPPARQADADPAGARPAMAPQAVRAPAEARPDSQRRASLPPSQPPPRVAAVRRAGAGPLATCSGLNFFARAVCMNNTCARPASARQAQCAQVQRQRRMDEARRNLTLSN